MRALHICLAGILAPVLLASATPGRDVPDPRTTPYARAPGLTALMDWVTFHLSFDGESFMPDMAAGAARPQLLGKPEFAPGVVGRAAAIGGTAAAIFPREGNFSLTGQGAASLWVCPVAWNHTSDGNVTLLMTSNSSFYVQRQGPLHGPDGRVQRHEGIQLLCLSPKTGNQCVMHGCGSWKNGEWHLLVVNWRWPRLELSVDGGAFSAAAVPRLPDESVFGNLIVGAQHGPRTLLDEVFLYRRPLTEEEVRLIWETLRPR